MSKKKGGFVELLYKTIMPKVYGIGAAIVIVGALFKIQHWEGAGIMLTVGLLTEAVIFFLSAFQPQPHDPDWSRVYPQLADDYHGEAASSGPGLTKKLDDMLKDADITPVTLGKLGDNFKKLGGTVDKMSDITDVVAATGDYTAKTREATQALATMKDAYTGAAQSIGYLNNAAEGTKLFHEQVQVLTKNLGSLNTIYELELQDTNNHLKAMNQYYGNLVQASQAMEGTVDDAKRAQDQIALLANNLGRLNQVYGNMLSAMQGRS